MFFLLFLALQAHGFSLLDVLAVRPELATLSRYVNKSTILTDLYSTTDSATLLAPSNTAFESWLPSVNITSDALDAVLAYHLLRGQFSALSITAQPSFVTSYLDNATYCNVTGGQRVALVADASGNPQVMSANRTLSSIVTKDVLFNGGLVQIIDSVLQIPPSYEGLVTQPNFSYDVALLASGGYLSSADEALVDSIIYRSNMTFFAPNTPTSLADFEDESRNSTANELAALFNYHAVPNFFGYSPNLTDGLQLQTLEGRDVVISVRDNVTYVNDARIFSSDYLVQNGVVHMIDGKLNPFNNTNSSLHTTHKSSRLSSGAIAGIVIGVIAWIAVVLIGICIKFWFRKSSSRDTLLSPMPASRRYDGREGFNNVQFQEMDSALSPIELSNEISTKHNRHEMCGDNSRPVELEGKVLGYGSNMFP